MISHGGGGLALRGGHLGAAGQPHHQRAGRLGGLRAARCRGADVVVAERHQHPRPEVLPRRPGRVQQESSLRQVVDRVVDTITDWASHDGYFADTVEAEAFRDELKHVVVTQRAAFNSPCRSTSASPACSPRRAPASSSRRRHHGSSSTGTWRRATIFKGGPGTASTSPASARPELLKGGDRLRSRQLHAGGRRLRRHHRVGGGHPPAGEDGHPRRRPPRHRRLRLVQGPRGAQARVLRDAGFDMDLDGKDSNSPHYQNPNNTGAGTDEFMQAVERRADWRSGRHHRCGARDRSPAASCPPDRRCAPGSAPTRMQLTPPSTGEHTAPRPGASTG